jgi:hypothetical protein
MRRIWAADMTLSDRRRCLRIYRVAHPGHRKGEPVLVASFGRDVEEVIGADEHVEPAPIAGIGVEHVALVVLVERAGARALLARKIIHELVIIHHLAAGFFLGRRRHLIVVVEIAAERRHPGEFPTHAFFESLDLDERRARDDDETDIALRQMDGGAVEMIGQVGTVRAAGFPARAEHEVIDDQLALAAEQVGERRFAVRGVEHIFLFDFFPRQFAAFLAQRVARLCKRLFVGEVRLARGGPVVVRNDLVRLHDVLLFCLSPLAGRGLARLDHSPTVGWGNVRRNIPPSCRARWSSRPDGGRARRRRRIVRA